MKLPQIRSAPLPSPPTIRQPSARQPARLFGYVRSKEQRPRNPKDSLDQQKDKLTAWAASRGLTFNEIFYEQGSDARVSLFRRSQGKAMLEWLRGGDWLVAARFDRLFGLPEDAHESLALARKRKFEVHALDVDSGRWCLARNQPINTILMALADDTQYGRSLQRKAVKANEATLKKYRGGRPPFGFRVGPASLLEEVSSEQAFIVQLHEMHAQKFTFEQMRNAGLGQGHRLTRAGIHKILHRDASTAKKL